MKLGITKDQLPLMMNHVCVLISGAGIGMFLAVAFIPEDDRKIFPFHYFVTAWVLVIGGSILRSSIVNWLRPKKAKEDLFDETHSA
jgi:hypothetical protein